jgi:Arc/MetJ family transcription regulator
MTDTLDIQSDASGYPAGMTKRLIDVDDEKLAAVRRELGTSTLKETVDAAFDEVLALVERRRELIGEIEGIDFSELADDDVRRARWSG